ncbi:MAG: hypothetical protein ACP5Q4_02000 [Candidatus Caldatribacteriaceae bacterium]
MIFCNQSKHAQGFTILETIITVGILAFLSFVMYATIIALGFRMRLELTRDSAYLLPESKSQVNQQVIVNQMNRFFTEVAREIRNAIRVSANGSSLQVVRDDHSSIVYQPRDYLANGKTVKTVVRSLNNQERIMVQGIKAFTVTQDGNLIHITTTVQVGGKEQVFQTSILKRNPESP